MVDQDGSGAISAAELHAVVRDAGIEMTQQEINSMIKNADVLERDGKISLP